jgi:Serpin (serine protease inhibitor)
MRMKNELRAAAVAAVAALLIAGCGSDPIPPPVMAQGVAAREPLMDPRPYGAADTAFGLDVLGTWCRADPQANLVLSPSSLASGLGMAYLGARGGTAQAMADVLHLPSAAGQALEAGLQARSAALRHLSGPGVTLEASDQVWADPGLPTKRSYLNAIATGYDAGVAQAPLLHHPEQARQELNQAIATATNGQIPQLLQPGSLNDIGWVLTDALYMHAAWATAFDADQTRPGPFTTVAGQQITAQFMTGGQFRAVRAGGWTAVWLPYRGGKLAMEALLPAAGAAGCTMPTAAALGTMTSRQRRHRGWHRADRRTRAASPGRIRPSLPDAGDRPRDRRAPLHIPGHQPLDMLISLRRRPFIVTMFYRSRKIKFKVNIPNGRGACPQSRLQRIPGGRRPRRGRRCLVTPCRLTGSRSSPAWTR